MSEFDRFVGSEKYIADEGLLASVNAAIALGLGNVLLSTAALAISLFSFGLDSFKCAFMFIFAPGLVNPVLGFDGSIILYYTKYGETLIGVSKLTG